MPPLSGRLCSIEPAPEVHHDDPDDVYREEDPMSRMLSALSSPHSKHRRNKHTKWREGRPRQVHGMTREQQEALIKEARAARLRELQRSDR